MQSLSRKSLFVVSVAPSTMETAVLLLDLLETDLLFVRSISI